MAGNMSNFAFAVNGNRILKRYPNWQQADYPQLTLIRLEIISDLELIEVHLGAKRKKHSDVTPYKKQEFDDWRYRTLQARSGLLSAKRAVEHEIASRKYRDSFRLLRDLLAIVVTIDEGDLDDQELASINEAKQLSNGK